MHQVDSMHPSLTAAQLRQDLNARARRLARDRALLHDESTGSQPSVLFGPDHAAQPARHGNFHPEAYARICASPDWLRRLTKPHTASRRSHARHDWPWRELDAAVSSDALLMNIFCHPQVFDGKRLAAPVAALLNVSPEAQPCFGNRPGVPLAAMLKPRGKKAAPRAALDRTEIDLTLSTSDATLFLEAKLTESDFQAAAPALILRYRDLEAVFDVGRLPQTRDALKPCPVSPNQAGVPHSSQPYLDEWDSQSPEPDFPDFPDFPDEAFLNLPTRVSTPRIAGYQLIRNVLAAYAASASFTDARRHDLIDAWYAILSAVHAPNFAWRLKLLTWQELAATLPPELQDFLSNKYGITP
jgi:hypothetical protein